jgi:hypothetical protein
MAVGVCQTCGARYTDADTETGYYFSSTSYAKGSYVSAATILAAAEEILTCPRDPGPTDKPDDKYPTGRTPAGGQMYEGDNRYTAGDETDKTRPDESADVTFGSF